MVLMNYKGKSKSGAKEENGVSLKWLICLMISVFANGFIAILTKMQQIKFDGTCDNEFQMISVGGSFLILALIGLISERKNLKAVIKTGAIWGGLAGLLNGAKNAAVIAVYLFLPLSTVSPLKTGLALIGAFLVSLIFYKEKYTLMQKIGVVLGVAAVVLLAL
jgi:drug/metabolite transporter (DMT)-like permease